MATLSFNSDGTNAAASTVVVNNGTHTLMIHNASDARVYITLDGDSDEISYRLDGTFSGGQSYTQPKFLRDHPALDSDPTSVRLQLDGRETVIMRVNSTGSFNARIAAGAAMIAHGTSNHENMRVYWELV